MSYQLFERLQLFVRAQNLFNTKYSTFGVIASPSHVLPGVSDPRFLGSPHPSAQRTADARCCACATGMRPAVR
jgi:hypothetical protein